MDETAKFCTNCGKPLSPESPSGTTTKETQGDTSEEVATGGPTDNQASGFRQGIHLLARLVQFILAGIAIILILGALMGRMNVLEFITVALFALILFAIVGIVELLVVRPLGVSLIGGGDRSSSEQQNPTGTPLDREPPPAENTIEVIEHVLLWYRENRPRRAITDIYLTRLQDQGNLNEFTEGELEYIRDAVQDYGQTIGRVDIEPSVREINSSFKKD